MRHFVGVGNCCLDTILTSVPHFVVEDDKLSASNVTRRRGGNSPNTIDVLEQLVSSDDKTKANIGLNLIAVLPDGSSPAVQEIRRSLGSGVSTANCIYRHECDEPASSYIIKNLATDSRTIISYNTLPDMNFEEFSQIAKSFGREATWYHFEGRIPAVTLDCIRHVRRSAPDVRVSVEIEKFPRQGLQELVPEADVVFYSKTWAINELKCSYEVLLNEQGNGYKSPEACLREQARLTPNALLLCCTWGAQGASVFEPTTGAYVHRDAWVLKDSSVIDTIGAGDTFIAGMLYSYLAHQQDWPLPQKLEFASELAGRKVIQEGFSGLGRLMRSE
ncbi:putative PfkB family kinase [Seiridium unicorne]|uniref:PfkB family kinase n=1 Tax=Seiridium unicorne TaxID=138068 RepID=A0ABR2UYW1_9PEZI